MFYDEKQIKCVNSLNTVKSETCNEKHNIVYLSNIYTIFKLKYVVRNQQTYN